MRTIIAGGRGYRWGDPHLRWLDEQHARQPITRVISGGSTGADQLGERWAELRRIPLLVVPARWSEHGRAAGPIRNAQMADMADCLICFPGGRGTKNMRELAAARSLSIIIYEGTC